MTRRKAGGERPERGAATEDALEPIRHRLAVIVEATGAGVYEHRVPPDDGGFRSERWAEILGYAAAELPPADRFPEWFHAQVAPEDVPRLRQAYADFLEGRSPTYAIEVRIRRKSGEWIWIRDLARATARDDRGRATRVVGATLDITEQKRLRWKERLLVAEVNHRAKNMLAAIQAMVLQTQLTAASVAEFADALTGRIGAMSRIHELLARDGWSGVRLHRLVSGALEPFVGTAAAVTLRGDDVTLPPRAAQALGLALHELATNAARHGALSTPAGRLTVTTAVEPAADGGGKLVVRWVEAGGPAVASPERRGFGSRLIERGLAYEAGGHAHLEFAPGGLRCYIEFPLAGAPESP